MALRPGAGHLGDEFRTSEQPLRLAWYGRALVVVGLAITVGTGVALYVAPRSVGEDFAWTIHAPLTAAFMGAGYLGGAAFGLVLVLRDGVWQRIRIILATAFVLVTTSLILTIRFFDEFALDGSGRQRALAWAWLIVYATLPPAVLAVFALHERRAGRAEWRVRSEPLTPFTRAAFATAAVVFACLGTWLTLDPDGALADNWPWKLPPLSAAIVGTWMFTLAAPFAWALLERDWRRVRIAALPVATTLVLSLLAAVRLSETFTGSGTAIAVYVTAIVLCVGLLGGVTLAQRRLTATNEAVAAG
jgi:hypothetical protein